MLAPILFMISVRAVLLPALLAIFHLRCSPLVAVFLFLLLDILSFAMVDMEENPLFGVNLSNINSSSHSLSVSEDVPLVEPPSAAVL